MSYQKRLGKKNALKQFFCFGLGFSGRALGQSLVSDGWRVSGTTRCPEKLKALEQEGFDVYLFPGEECLIEEQIFSATHMLITIPPQGEEDIVIKKYREAITRGQNLHWLGYISSTGVYGNRGGEWVDENSDLTPCNERSRLRLETENQWLEMGRKERVGIHIFRSAGIYGPGRNMLESVKSGRAKRIEKKGQVNSRIHVEDLVSVLKASMVRPKPGSIYNVCDDEPVPSKEVVEFACQLLKMDPPPVIPFNEAKLPEITRTFYLENKKIRNEKIKSELNIKLKYPNYRKGLNTILQEIKIGSET